MVHILASTCFLGNNIDHNLTESSGITYCHTIFPVTFYNETLFFLLYERSENLCILSHCCRHIKGFWIQFHMSMFVLIVKICSPVWSLHIHAVNGIIYLINEILIFLSCHDIVRSLAKVLNRLLIFRCADVAVYQRIYFIIDQCICQFCRCFIINDLAGEPFFFCKFQKFCFYILFSSITSCKFPFPDLIRYGIYSLIFVFDLYMPYSELSGM